MAPTNRNALATLNPNPSAEALVSADLLRLEMSNDRNINAAATPEIPINTRCAPCVPSCAMSRMLVPNAPMIAPTVFAAYTFPIIRPASCPGEATAARASGKLAPHKIVGGSTAQKQRARSS
jgi:hypothetical protein